MQTRLGGARNSQEACSTGWGQGACKPGEGIEDAKLGRGCRGVADRKGQSARGREFAQWRKTALISQVGAVKSHGGGGGLQAHKSVGTWEECSMWSSPGSGHANPGRAGPSRQGGLCRERVGGITGGLAQPGGCARAARPQSTLRGRTLAGG